MKTKKTLLALALVSAGLVAVPAAFAQNAPADNVYPTGTIAMARGANDAYSNGHQFFIVTDTTTLGADSAGGYTIVGKVTSGLEDLIQQVTSKGIKEVGSDGVTGTPNVPTSITSVTLR